MHWHLANLEFACAAPLTTVSAQDWDQDDANEYDGDHMILPAGGYGALCHKLAEGLDIRLRCTARISPDRWAPQTKEPPSGARLSSELAFVSAAAGACCQRWRRLAVRLCSLQLRHHLLNVLHVRPPKFYKKKTNGALI